MSPSQGVTTSSGGGIAHASPPSHTFARVGLRNAVSLGFSFARRSRKRCRQNRHSHYIRLCAAFGSGVNFSQPQKYNYFWVFSCVFVFFVLFGLVWQTLSETYSKKGRVRGPGGIWGTPTVSKPSPQSSWKSCRTDQRCVGGAARRGTADHDT